VPDRTCNFSAPGLDIFRLQQPVAVARRLREDRNPDAGRRRRVSRRDTVIYGCNSIRFPRKSAWTKAGERRDG